MSRRGCSNDYTPPGTVRSFPLSSPHRRGDGSLTRILHGDAADQDLDLFSRNRRSVSLASSSGESAALSKLGRLSVGSGSSKMVRNGVDDLLASIDVGKHDYDWLLTPPESPLFPEGNGFHSILEVPRSSTPARPSSAIKSSRPSMTHTDISSSYRPARSSSASRSSFSYAQNSSYSSFKSPSSILSTSSASVSSYIRPSSPLTFSTSVARPSTPSARTKVSSRSSTPTKPRSPPMLSSIKNHLPSQRSRSSTPTSRPQRNTSPQASVSTSRSSTPTRRVTASATSSTSDILASTARILSNGRNHIAASRSSSSSPRLRSHQPVVPHDFPLDTPPNLRTSLPNRSVSAGRSWPATENHDSVTLPRRPSSPIMTRSRSVEPPGNGLLNASGHAVDVFESRKISNAPESPMRKPLKSSIGTEKGGFGRSISKKSLDMAIRHMDIRLGPGSTRPLPGTILYPQSIRTAGAKTQPVHASIPETSIDTGGSPSLFASNNGYIHESAKCANGCLEDGRLQENGRKFGRLIGMDMFESTRYDTMLLKEDLKNTNWLHSLEVEATAFEDGIEHLPEPFTLS